MQTIVRITLVLGLAFASVACQQTQTPATGIDAPAAVATGYTKEALVGKWLLVNVEATPNLDSVPEPDQDFLIAGLKNAEEVYRDRAAEFYLQYRADGTAETSVPGVMDINVNVEKGPWQLINNGTTLESPHGTYTILALTTDSLRLRTGDYSATYTYQFARSRE